MHKATKTKKKKNSSEMRWSTILGHTIPPNFSEIFWPFFFFFQMSKSLTYLFLDIST